MNQLSIGIIGLGQIGGSIAAALRQSSDQFQIHGYDVKSDLMAAAHARGYLSEVRGSQDELVNRCDIVIIALPMDQLFASIKSHASVLNDKRLVIDTGSLKAHVVALAEELELTNFVGGHPLAGTEKRGSDAWHETLFVEKNYFLTPTMHTKPEAYRLACELVNAIGGCIVEIGSEQHDEIFATTSNVPHLFAFLLQHKFDSLSASDEKVTRFVCPSFYGATRVAKSDPEMVFQMLWHNRRQLGDTLDELIERLRACRASLSDADEIAFRKYFQKS